MDSVWDCGGFADIIHINDPRGMNRDLAGMRGTGGNEPAACGDAGLL